MTITIQELLRLTVEKDASDLHITTYIPPRVRIHGDLVSLDYPPLAPAETKSIVYSLLTDRQKKMFEEKLELDFSFGVKDLGRFRGNVFMWLQLSGGFSPTCGVFPSSAFPSDWRSSVIFPGGW